MIGWHSTCLVHDVSCCLIFWKHCGGGLLVMYLFVNFVGVFAGMGSFWLDIKVALWYARGGGSLQVVLSLTLFF